MKPTFKPWEDKKDYEAIFKKFISIGEDGEEHYDVIDKEIEAERAVRRITDHQEIVKQYQKVVKAYDNFMKDYPWTCTEGLMQDNCEFVNMLKDEKRKSQFEHELERLMGEYAVPLPLGNFNMSNKETRRLELWNNQRGMWFDHVEQMEEGQEKNKEWENFWWTVDEDMFTYVMKSKIEELIEEKLNQEFTEEVEIRENQDFESDEEMTSETEDIDNKVGRTKIDPRGKNSLFVGYSTQHAGDVYSLLNPKTSRVIHSRDVKWIGKMWVEFYKIKTIDRASGYVDPDEDFQVEEEEDQDIEEEETEPEGDESEVIQVGQSQAEEPTETPVGVADDEAVASRTRSQTAADEPIAARTRQAVGSDPEMSAFADVKDEKTLNEWLHEIAFVTSTMSDPDEPQSFQEAWWDPDLVARYKW